VQQTLAAAQTRLSAAGIPDGALEAQVLACHVTGWDRARLLASLRDPFPAGAVQSMNTLLLRRASREPLAYITGHREFFGIDLLVDNRVLVPRQETECLVERVLAIVTEHSAERPLEIADVGTGSGAVAISLAKSLPRATVYGTDISAGALDIAAENARRTGVENRTVFRLGNLLEPVTEPLDIVVANLPYIPEAAWERLQPEIRLFEPRAALLSGAFGLDAVRALLEQVRSRPSKPQWLVLELGDGQAEAVSVMAQGLVDAVETQVYKDLAGLERGIAIRLNLA
jgi:release factor glutamine methyltransferase